MNAQNPPSDENDKTFVAGSGISPESDGSLDTIRKTPGGPSNERRSEGMNPGSGAMDHPAASSPTVIGFSTDGDGRTGIGRTQNGGPDDSGIVNRTAATTVIGPQHRKDSEDFFDTLEDSSGDIEGEPRRGFVIGDYLIVEELGRGGMGVVYKARHRKLNRLVAIKMILAGQHSDSETVRRFISEAQAVARFQHPGIVQIFEIGEHHGLPYMVLELVEGTDLQRDLKGLPRDARRSAELVESLCHAMQYAHDHKVLHRDLKPSNVLLTQDGKPKILDFGLARNLEASDSGGTSDGTVLGSPSYMSPEQAGGQLSMISVRSDVYSLGAILYQMLTSRPPFVGERPYDTIMQVINNEPVSPRSLMPDIPVDLETVCLKALQKNAESRYATCGEFAADLRRFLNGEPVVARPVSPLTKAWRWCRRNPRIAVPSGLAGLFITLTACISTWAWFATSAQAKQIEQERDNAVTQKNIANSNEELARKQAMSTLQTIQEILGEVDIRLRAFPNAADVRLAVLQTLEKKCTAIDQSLVGGIAGEAAPTLLAIRSRIAEIYNDLGKFKEADERYAALIKDAEARVAVKDRTDATRYNLATILNSWAPIRARVTGNPEETTRLLTQARETLLDVLANPRPAPRGPKYIQIKHLLGKAILTSANLHLKNGQVRELERDQKELRTIAEEMQKEISQGADWFQSESDTVRQDIQRVFAGYLLASRTLEAELCLRQSKREQALTILEEVLQKSRQDAEGATPDKVAFSKLEESLRTTGRKLSAVQQYERAAVLLEEAVACSEQILAVKPDAADSNRFLANNLYQLAIAYERLGAADKAGPALQRAVAIRKKMHADSADVANKTGLVLCTSAAGLTNDANVLIGELSAIEAKNAELRIDIARAQANLCRHETGEQKAAAQQGALDNIRRAITEGLTDPFALNGTPEFDALRELPEFVKMVQELEMSQQ